MKFIHNGVRYKSVPEVIEGTCDGCAFASKPCDDIVLNTSCGNNHIIFVKTKKQPQNKYQYWSGDKPMPVNDDIEVDIIQRNGETQTDEAGVFRWDHAVINDPILIADCDIIAWRFHNEN